MANEGREVNASWDAVWFVKTSLPGDGWIAEIAIPFTSLRFDLANAPVWGVNFSRRIRRRNEVDFWSPVPRAYTLTRVSLAGDLAGLGSTHPGRDFRVKPYVAASTVRDTGGESFHGSGDVGVDVKYGLTRALTLDATVKPDFAQVEADEQQVNLTQFSQFFPEKREFFLENSGVFYVGDAARNNRVTYLAPQPDTDLLLFFSRRIGLTADGLPIPILAGGRLTGNLAGLTIGALTVQTERTDQEPENNFSVIRVRKNVFANSDVGGIFMSRQSADQSGDFNRVYGVDSNIRFFGDLDWSTYLVKTDTPGLGAGQNAFRTTINRDGNFFHLKTGYMSIGDSFNDELGYYRRIGVRKYILDTGVRPRPKSFQSKGIRELHPHVTWSLFTDHEGQMVAKTLHSGFTFFFNNGGHSQIAANPTYELLTSPLTLHPDAPPLPPGGYSWTTYVYDFSTDPSRAISRFGRNHARWSLERDAEDVLGNGQLQTVLQLPSEPEAQPNGREPRPARRGFRHHALDDPGELLVRDEHLSRLPHPVRRRPAPIQCQHPIQHHLPSAERPLRRLQRTALRDAGEPHPRRPGDYRQVHPDVLVLEVGTAPLFRPPEKWCLSLLFQRRA